MQNQNRKSVLTFWIRLNRTFRYFDFSRIFLSLHFHFVRIDEQIFSCWMRTEKCRGIIVFPFCCSISGISVLFFSFAWRRLLLILVKCISTNHFVHLKRTHIFHHQKDEAGGFFLVFIFGWSVRFARHSNDDVSHSFVSRTLSTTWNFLISRMKTFLSNFSSDSFASSNLFSFRIVNFVHACVSACVCLHLCTCALDSQQLQAGSRVCILRSFQFAWRKKKNKRIIFSPHLWRPTHVCLLSAHSLSVSILLLSHSYCRLFVG